MVNSAQIRSLIKVFLLLLSASLILSFRAEASPIVKPLAQPTFSKLFSPDNMGPGSVSTLTFTIMNGAAAGVTDLAFTDTLPAGVTIATPANPSSSCGDTATLTAPDGGSTITFSNGQIGASSSCTITVDVTSSTPGTHMNVTGDLTSSAGNGGTASDDLTVATDRPGFSKSFAPSAVQLGSRSTLTFTIDNSANASAATMLDFTDNLPAGLVVAGPANATTDCNDPLIPATLTATPGSSVITLDANGTGAFPALAAGATCTVVVDVIATGSGSLNNVTEDLLAIVGVSQRSSGKASAAITVTADDLGLVKSFPDDPTRPGDTTILEFTITNRDRNFSATSIAFSDDLNASLAGLAAVGLPQSDVCGAGSQLSGTTALALSGGNLAPEASCTFSVTLQIPAAAASGPYPNTTSSITAQVNGVQRVGSPAAESLFIQPAPRLTKAFLTNPVGGGATVTVQFSITNISAASSATEIAFTDNLDQFLSGTQVSNLPANGFCGGGSSLTVVTPFDDKILTMTGGSLNPAGTAGDSCTFTVDFLIPSGAPGGNLVNTTSEISAMVGGVKVFGKEASAPLQVVKAPDLRKSFIEDVVLAGGTITLEFSLIHDVNAAGDATAITFSDDLNATLAGLVAIGLPLNDVCGAGSQISGTSALSFTGGSLAPGATCTFKVTLQVPASALPGSYTNTTSDVSATVLGIAALETPGQAELKVAGISLAKLFKSNPVLPGDTVSLEFTLVNSTTTTGVTNMSFSDNLNGALTGLAATGLPKNDICGAGSQINGTTNLNFTGGNLAAGASCTFTVDVVVPVAATEGTYGNTTSGLVANFGGTIVVVDPAVDDLTVVTEVMLLSKKFNEDAVFGGTTTTLVFTVTNSFSSATATAITFSDDLNAAISGLTATGLPQNDVCGAGSQLSGTTNLSLTGGSLAAGASCVFSVILQVPGSVATAEYTNVTGQVTAAMNSATVTGSPATDSLQVINPTTSGQIIIDKVTNPSGNLTSFNFTLDGGPSSFNRTTFSLTDAAAPRATVVDAGSGYIATEGATAGWKQGSAVCNDGSSVGNISVSAGETVICTFTNLEFRATYLPFIFKDAIYLPDLTIDSFQASGNMVTLTLRNAGNTALSDSFWVQISINPATPPTAVNQRWDTLGNSLGGAPQGALWGVVNPAVPILPNATLTLTLNDVYYYTGSPANNVPNPIPVGSTVYAQLDAINFLTNHGNILESNEANNIATTVSTAGFSLAPASTPGVSPLKLAPLVLPGLEN